MYKITGFLVNITFLLSQLPLSRLLNLSFFLIWKMDIITVITVTILLTIIIIITTTCHCPSLVIVILIITIMILPYRAIVRIK